MRALLALERSLARAVDQGAAEAPASEHDSPHPSVASPGRPWQPRGRRLLATLLLAGSVTGGVLVAGSALPDHREPPPARTP